VAEEPRSLAEELEDWNPMAVVAGQFCDHEFTPRAKFDHWGWIWHLFRGVVVPQGW
jgi:hypothetical protein